MGRRTSRKSFLHFGARSRRSATVWLLIASFFLQPVLAYLVTPVVILDGKGHHVVACTLEGLKLVSLEMPLLADEADTDYCSALKLYQLAGNAQLATPPAPLPVHLYSIGLLDQTVARTHRSLHFSAYSTRAPPRLS